jgi:putative flippase GtrA
MKQFSRFLLVGVANTALGYAVIFGCMYFGGLTPELSNGVGYLVGLLVSYSLNRRITFKSVRRRSTEFVRFVLVFLVAYTSNLAVLVVLIRGLSVHAVLSQILAGVVYIGTSYLLYKHYAFKSSGVS